MPVRTGGQVDRSGITWELASGHALGSRLDFINGGGRSCPLWVTTFPILDHALCTWRRAEQQQACVADAS